MRLRSGIRTVVGAGLAVFAGAAAADAQQTALRDLKVGDVAPVFEGLADNGQKWSSEQGRKGGLLVVYFYPAAMTGGCTAQACMFRDNRTVLQDLDAEVIGRAILSSRTRDGVDFLRLSRTLPEWEAEPFTGRPVMIVLRAGIHEAQAE